MKKTVIIMITIAMLITLTLTSMGASQVVVSQGNNQFVFYEKTTGNILFVANQYIVVSPTVITTSVVINNKTYNSTQKYSPATTGIATVSRFEIPTNLSTVKIVYKNGRYILTKK